VRDSPQSLPTPRGALLAGGQGRRLGGAKACVPVAGRPLLDWPLAALTAALQRVAVVAKADTRLPPLPPGVDRWDEPPQPQHPLVGILEALRRAEGEAVVVCAVDLPCVDPELVGLIAAADAGRAGIVIAAADGRPQPLLGRYEAAARAALERVPAGSRLTDAVTDLGAAVVEVPATALLNVNDEEDRRRAERVLSGDVADGD
jgi:molybdopterin-guanine dinucleotide biosynthesis protein A